MTIRPIFIAYILSSSVHALAAQNQCPVTCPATEQAVREVEHLERQKCEENSRRS
jgi:hypothetical protein